jgi:hypothetical protein
VKGKREVTPGKGGTAGSWTRCGFSRKSQRFANPCWSAALAMVRCCWR